MNDGTTKATATPTPPQWETPRPTNQPKTLSVTAATEHANVNARGTPPGLIDAIHDVMGAIDLDPCTAPDNPCRADRFYTKDDDGILMPWEANRIYCNPPYGKTIGKWVDKCLFAAGNGSKVILLAPARPGSVWFRRAWHDAAEVLFINGRLRFAGADHPARFPSVLFAYNITLEKLSGYGLRGRKVE